MLYSVSADALHLFRLILDTLRVMKVMSVQEQKYQAVLAVIAEGRSVKDVAAQFGVSRQSLHAWLRRYEELGLDGLADRSRRPWSCPHQMPEGVEVAVLELRRVHPYWGPRRIVYELGRRGVEPLPSESGVYRALLRAGLVDPDKRRGRREKWKRWERAAPMELWQMDVVGGVGLAGGGTAKILTGVDDFSRFCVSARVMRRERTRAVCDGLQAALDAYGAPEQILTDNGRVFTGRHNDPPVEVLFEKICRVNGIEKLHTKPRSPTTTGKIERFHRTLREEFLTGRVFRDVADAQRQLDGWVQHYNTDRPHFANDMEPPAEHFRSARTRGQAADNEVAAAGGIPAPRSPADRGGDDWVARKVSAVGVVCVSWQQVSVGKHRAGERCDVHVMPESLQLWIGDELVKTVTRTSSGPVRKKRAQRSS